jgi:hypothetical protein
MLVTEKFRDYVSRGERQDLNFFYEMKTSVLNGAINEIFKISGSKHFSTIFQRLGATITRLQTRKTLLES